MTFRIFYDERSRAVKLSPSRVGVRFLNEIVAIANPDDTIRILNTVNGNMEFARLDPNDVLDIDGNPVDSDVNVVVNYLNSQMVRDATLAPPVITFPTDVNVGVGSNQNILVTTDNFPLVWEAIGLPPGLVIIPDTGRIIGVTTTPGDYSVDITASNLAGSDSISTTFHVLSGFLNEKSVVFDRSSNHYVTASDTSVPPELLFFEGDAFSVSVWENISALGQLKTLFSSGKTAGEQGWKLYISASGHIEIDIKDDSNGVYNMFTADGVVTTSGWSNIVMTYNGQGINVNNFKIFQNGNQIGLFVGTTNFSTQIPDLTVASSFRFGRSSNGSDGFDGNLDEISVWNKTLSQAEANEIYSGGTPDDLSLHSGSANLVGWWRMGDGDTFPTLLDNSINSNDLTMINMTILDIINSSP